MTLAVTPKQADLLALADVYTTLRLALRSSDESLRSYPTEPIVFGAPDHPQNAPPAAPGVVAVQPTFAQPKPAAPERPRAAAYPYVQVIEGDHAAAREDRMQ